MQPGNCHGDYMILLDYEQLYTRLEPNFSPVNIRGVGRILGKGGLKYKKVPAREARTEKFFNHAH